MSNNITHVDIANSTSPAPIEDSGIIKRGKYTLLTKFDDPIRDAADTPIPLAKKVQGNRAANIKMAYGYPSDGIFAKFPKTTVNTTY
jgi:hypothetical protein